jgi:1-acyl-sn-glycerol-3-phosphate acyltransferase
VFGEPLSPADYDDPKAGKDRAQVASERIMAAIARLRLPPETIV